MPSRSKDPGYQGWPYLRVTQENVDEYFPSGAHLNIGILNGLPSGNIVDVDLDCPEALAAAPLVLPRTGWRFGRKTAPGSHWIFKTDVSLDKAQEEFKDLDGQMLVELRGSGGLTVYPPSLHRETGERISWEEFSSPAEVALAVLQQEVGVVAAAALLARHWPAKGSRDAAAMALSGGLIRGGWNEDQVSRFVHAVAVAAGDEEARMRAGKAAPTARKEGDGKKTTGWPKLEELLGEQGKEVIRRVRQWLGLTVPATPIETIPEETSWPDPLAQEAYYGLTGQIVRTIEPSSEADPVALLVQTLVGFGNILGRTAHFTVESDWHYGNEFAVLVGRTSKARKGTSWGRISQLFVEVEKTWMEERVQSGASSGEGIIWAVRDQIMKRERIKERGQAPRYEDVEADPGVEDKRLLVYEPEFANVLKQTERQGNTLSVILRQAWDSVLTLRTLTKNSPAKATGALISLIGHITVEELRRYLTTTEAANGFGNRHLWICAQRSKLLPEGGRLDSQKWEGLRNDLAEALAFARTVENMRRDDDARELWRDIYSELSEGKPGLAGALLARGEAHVMRLAMLYALLDRSALIQAPHLLAGLAIWEYCERSVRFIFGDSLGDPVADDLLRLIRSCPGITRTQIRDHFQRNASSDRIGRALGLLLQARLIRREEVETAGRPAERWFPVLRASR